MRVPKFAPQLPGQRFANASGRGSVVLPSGTGARRGAGRFCSIGGHAHGGEREDFYAEEEKRSAGRVNMIGQRMKKTKSGE